MKLNRLDNTMHFEDIDINAIRQMLWKNEEDRLFGKNVTKQQDNPEFHPIKRGARLCFRKWLDISKLSL